MKHVERRLEEGRVTGSWYGSLVEDVGPVRLRAKKILSFQTRSLGSEVAYERYVGAAIALAIGFEESEALLAFLRESS